MADVDPLFFLPPYIEQVADGILRARHVKPSDATPLQRMAARRSAVMLTHTWAQGLGRVGSELVRQNARDALVAWHTAKGNAQSWDA